MTTLFHHPFCPHSRFVRLALGELGITPRLVEERVWERREEFLALNPEGKTPVLIEEGHPAVPGAGVIAEYLDETRGADAGDGGWFRAVPFAARVSGGSCRSIHSLAWKCGGSRTGSTRNSSAR